MVIDIVNNRAEFSKNKYVLLFGYLIIIPVLILFNEFRFDIKVLSLFIAIPFLGLFLFSFEVMLWAFMSILFINFYSLGLQTAVLAVIPLSFAYIITHRAKEKNNFRSPLTIPISIYVLSIIPSFLNSTNILLSLYLTFNLVAFIILYNLISKYIEEIKMIEKVLKAFLYLALINGFTIIVLSLLTKSRQFGFTGVVYVDFVCIAIIIAFFLFFSSKDNKKYLYALACAILFISLIFTQTRNTLISLSITSLFLFYFFYKYNNYFDLNRKKIIVDIILGFLLIGVIVLVLYILSPNTFQRISEINGKQNIKIEHAAQFGVSTLLTRLLIWYTALTAFLAHPIIGIGAFSFPFESVNYFKVPPVLYKDYVQGLSPHLTILAVLTETGIVGFIGFLIFVVSTLRMGLKSFKMSNNLNSRTLSLLLLSIQIYIALSMLLTDAWLWGQCGMLWGLALGVSLANYKLLLNGEHKNYK